MATSGDEALNQQGTRVRLRLTTRPALGVRTNGPVSRVLAEDLVDEESSVLAAGVRKALLDHVAGELVLGQRQDLALERAHHRRAVLRRPVDQHVLDHVVAVLVLAQLVRVVQNLGKNAVLRTRADTIQASEPQDSRN